MTSLKWLHFSDLHFGMKNQIFLWPNLRERFFEDLERLHAGSGPWDLVFFSGDLTQSGTPEEFDGAAGVLDEVLERMISLGSDPVVLTVPGNHDLKRPPPESAVATAMEFFFDKLKIRERFWEEDQCEYRRLVNEVFDPYIEWCNGQWGKKHPYPPHSRYREGIIPGDFSCSFEKAGLLIGIVGLNSAFLQLSNGVEKEHLELNIRQLHAVCDNDVPRWTRRHHICLLMTHHPPNWLHDKAREEYRSEISPPGRFLLHLFGHMHESNYISLRIGGGASTRHVQGFSLFGIENWGDGEVGRTHGYIAGEISVDRKKGRIRLWPRKAVKQKDGSWKIAPDHTLDLDDDGALNEIFVPRGKKIPPPQHGTRPDPMLRRNFNHLIRDHTSLFAGREDEFSEIRRYIGEEECGYIFIEAVSGYGKTSLLSTLVKEHRDYAYHFISQAYKRHGSDFDPTEMDPLVRNLCEQVEIMEELYCDEGVPPKERLRDYLQYSPGKGCRVFVIDAVDEINRHPNYLHGLLPSKLPVGVFVIISARIMGDRSYLSEIGLKRIDVGLEINLPGLNEKDISKLLESAGGKAAALHGIRKFVKELNRVSGGDPFYLRFLVEDILAGDVTDGNISDIPKGLNAYFDLQLSLLDRSAHLRQHRDIIGIILEARGPISRNDLIKMVEGLDGLNFNTVLRDIHRFLLVHDNAYTFCHNRFKEYFAAQVVGTEVSNAEKDDR